MFNWFKGSVPEKSEPPKDEFTQRDIDILNLFSNANFDNRALFANYSDKDLKALTDKLDKSGYFIDKRTQVFY